MLVVKYLSSIDMPKLHNMVNNNENNLIGKENIEYTEILNIVCTFPHLFLR